MAQNIDRNTIYNINFKFYLFQTNTRGNYACMTLCSPISLSLTKYNTNKTYLLLN